MPWEITAQRVTQQSPFHTVLSNSKDEKIFQSFSFKQCLYYQYLLFFIVIIVNSYEEVFLPWQPFQEQYIIGASVPVGLCFFLIFFFFFLMSHTLRTKIQSVVLWFHTVLYFTFSEMSLDLSYAILLHHLDTSWTMCPAGRGSTKCVPYVSKIMPLIFLTVSWEKYFKFSQL